MILYVIVSQIRFQIYSAHNKIFNKGLRQFLFSANHFVHDFHPFRYLLCVFQRKLYLESCLKYFIACYNISFYHIQ